MLLKSLILKEKKDISIHSHHFPSDREPLGLGSNKPKLKRVANLNYFLSPKFVQSSENIEESPQYKGSTRRPPFFLGKEFQICFQH